MTKLAKVFSIALLLSGSVMANDLPPVDETAAVETEQVSVRSIKQDTADSEFNITDWAALAKDGYHMAEFVGKNQEIMASAKDAGLTVFETDEGFTVVLDTDQKDLVEILCNA